MFYNNRIDPDTHLELARTLRDIERATWKLYGLLTDLPKTHPIKLGVSRLLESTFRRLRRELDNDYAKIREKPPSIYYPYPED